MIAIVRCPGCGCLLNPEWFTGHAPACPNSDEKENR